MAVQAKKLTSVKRRTSNTSSKRLSETEGTENAHAKTGDLGKPEAGKRRPGKDGPSKDGSSHIPAVAKQSPSLNVKTSVRPLPGSATLVSDTKSGSAYRNGCLPTSLVLQIAPSQPGSPVGRSLRSP